VKLQSFKLSIGQQLALLAGASALLIALVLVGLGTYSSRHLQLEQQDAFGAALARQVATRLGTSLDSGDLLNLGATLQHFVATSSAERVEVYDVEGKALGVAGQAQGDHVRDYFAPVTIDDNIAGEVRVTVSIDKYRDSQDLLALGLLGMSLLLSLGTYLVARLFTQRLGAEIHQLAERLSLAEPDQQAPVAHSFDNELTLLQHNIDELPLELLRANRTPGAREQDYGDTAVLYVQLHSLADYVDTLDERALQRYIRQVHQVIYGAAGFYHGQLQVARQFGLAIYFSGGHSAGSPTWRAACTAWLIGELYKELQNYIPLSTRHSQAIGLSELGVGSDQDIYPGLYMQHLLDELKLVCDNKPPNILLSQAAAADQQLAQTLEIHPTEVHGYSALTLFPQEQRELLERQLRLVWKHLTRPE
jgi:uncharacterized membrane protein affecting hemolysin expression